MRAAGYTLLIAAAVIYALPVVERALANRRKRHARMAIAGTRTWLDTLVQEAVEDGVSEADDRIYQQMHFERWENEMAGGAS